MLSPAQTWPSPPSGRLDIPAGKVHLWRASLQPQPAVLEWLTSFLSPPERERASRFRFSKDQLRFTAGRGILRELLSRYTGRPPSELVFGYGPAGKPFLLDDGGAPSPLEFNLAHSHGLAIYGFAVKAPIGVDVELIRDGVEIEKLAARFFTPSEAEGLRSLPEPERRPAFFRAWTRKEAFLKALGHGLRAGLASCEVALEAGSGDALLRYRGDPQAPRRWRLQDVQLHPDYCAAMAVADRSSAVLYWDWPEPAL